MRGTTLLLTLLFTSSLSGCIFGEDDDSGGSAGTMPVGADNNTTMGNMTPMLIAVQLSGAYPANIAFSPAALTVDNNTTVTVEFTNNDVNPLINHDWALEGFEDVAQTATVANGATTNVTFEVPPAGTYTFYCSVPGHRGNGMEGTFTVV